MTTLLQIVLALAIITTVVDSAAIGDIARNVHSDLLTLDAGLNPQPVRSPRQDFDVPAGMLTLTPFFIEKSNNTRCLKITEKVSFNIASEASYVYILNRQKLIKNAKMVNLASF